MWAFIHSNWNSITNLRQQTNMIQNPFSDMLVEMLSKIYTWSIQLFAFRQIQTLRMSGLEHPTNRDWKTQIPRPLQSDLATNTLVAILLELPKDLKKQQTNTRWNRNETVSSYPKSLWSTDMGFTFHLLGPNKNPNGETCFSTSLHLEGMFCLLSATSARASSKQQKS